MGDRVREVCGSVSRRTSKGHFKDFDLSELDGKPLHGFALAER